MLKMDWKIFNSYVPLERLDMDKILKKKVQNTEKTKKDARNLTPQLQIRDFIKVARNTYPVYKNWREKILLEPSSWCAEQLVKRWKFNCKLGKRIPPTQSTNGKGKTPKKTWQAQLENFFYDQKKSSPMPFPVLNILSILLKCVSNFLRNDHFGEEIEDIGIILQENFEGKFLAVIIVSDASKRMKISVKDYLLSAPIEWDLEAAYLKTLERKFELVYGAGGSLQENMEKITFNVNAQMVDSTNINNFVAIAQCVHIFGHDPDATLVTVECTTGIIPLWLAQKFKMTIGLQSIGIGEAEELKLENNIKNVEFLKVDMNGVERLFKELENCTKVTVLINQPEDDGQMALLMIRLNALRSVKKIIVVTSLSEKCFYSLLELVRPTREFRFNLIYTHAIEGPTGNDFQHVLFFKRALS